LALEGAAEKTRKKVPKSNRVPTQGDKRGLEWPPRLAWSSTCEEERHYLSVLGEKKEDVHQRMKERAGFAGKRQGGTLQNPFRRSSTRGGRINYIDHRWDLSPWASFFLLLSWKGYSNEKMNIQEGLSPQRGNPSNPKKRKGGYLYFSAFLIGGKRKICQASSTTFYRGDCLFLSLEEGWLLSGKHDY